MPHAKRTATGVFGGLLGLVGLSTVAGLLITATVTPAIAVSGYAASSAIEMFDNMPSYLKIEKLMLPTSIYAKDENGKNRKLTEFFDQNRIPVTFDEVNPVVYDAILSSEDKKFYEHGGIDLIGTVSALASNASSGSNRGGSSITQQYVKNVLQQNCETAANGDEKLVRECYLQSTVNTGPAGYQRKLQEMRYAIQLEKEYSKDEILIGYLNIAHFGGTVYGIGAAASYYFGTTADKLTIGQAAAIAGMVQEPNTYRLDLSKGTRTAADGTPINNADDGFSLTKKRQVYVLGRMLADGKITQEEHDTAVEAPIEPKITKRDQGCSEAEGAEFFCQYVVSIIRQDDAFGDSDDNISTLRRGGLKVYTTLDLELQEAAQDAVSIVPAYRDDMDLGASGVQVEVGTGRVLSMVQNRPWSDDPDGDRTTQVNYNAPEINGGGQGHSAGSTYKVFSLINWLQEGRSANAVLNGRTGEKNVITCDGATQTVYTGQGKDPFGGDKIRNFENNPGYSGTVARFTKDSLNTGFFAMAEDLSVCSTNEVAGQLGVTWGDGTVLTDVPAWSNDPPNVPYNVLGSSAVAPIQMANAYAAIASNGILCKAKLIDRVIDADGNDHPLPETKCERALSEDVASTAAWVLESVMTGSGTGSGARTYDGVPIFGKTGIHQYIHTWMIGSSTEVTTAVWVGNVEGAKKLDERWESGYRLSRIRNGIWPDMQRAANAKFGGESFPGPSAELTKRSYSNLPSVIGLSIDQAVDRIEDAGFSAVVGDEVNATEAAGTIVSQSPGAGRVVSGSTVVINPSNGEGATVPGVGGTPQQAAELLRAAGFSNLTVSCTDAEGTPREGVVTGTDPSAGETVSKNDRITIQYATPDCDGNGDDGGNDPGDQRGPGNGNRP
ncbi:transglycosylase domain-containing protein [Microbacterium sp.]|uniref:transglycosylase domain-containing protein n=1 Tax=Microbacterium sp. TaxID=51671 RepID=UPI00373638FB